MVAPTMMVAPASAAEEHSEQVGQNGKLTRIQGALDSLVAPSPLATPSDPTRGPGSLTAHKDTKSQPTPSTWKSPVVLCLSALIAIVCLSVELDPEYPDAGKGLLVLLITALWWVTEVVPLVVTAFVPVVLYPLLRIASSGQLAKAFFTGTSFLFVSGFLLAHGVEHWRLHERAVCAITASIGRSAERLSAGCMFSVWALSMWLPNVFPVLAFLPIADAFLETLPRGHEYFRKGFILAIGWSATCGGIATPVGTPTNGIFLEIYAQLWPESPEFSFATFTLSALPLSFALLVFLWLGFCTLFIWRNTEPRVVVNRSTFAAKYRALGKTSWEQMVIGSTFVTLIVLWFTMSPIGDSFAGWKASVAPGINAGSVGLGFTIPLFLVPAGRRLPRWMRRLLGEERCRSAAQPESRCILEWEAATKSGTLMHLYQLLFVFGGGASIALGTTKSGLASVMANVLARTATDRLLFISLATLATSLTTELVSNMATLSIFGPVLAVTAQRAGLDSVQTLFAVTLASSFGFMLPMSTGPNLVLFARGGLPLRFMARHGAYLNVVAITCGALYFTYVLPITLGTHAHVDPSGMRGASGGAMRGAPPTRMHGH